MVRAAGAGRVRLDAGERPAEKLHAMPEWLASAVRAAELGALQLGRFRKLVTR